MTHGGGNSIVESIYYGKALIGFPQAADQMGSCYRIGNLGIGVSLNSTTPTGKEMLRAIKKVRPVRGKVNTY